MHLRTINEPYSRHIHNNAIPVVRWDYHERLELRKTFNHALKRFGQPHQPVRRKILTTLPQHLTSPFFNNGNVMPDKPSPRIIDNARVLLSIASIKRFEPRVMQCLRQTDLPKPHSQRQRERRRDYLLGRHGLDDRRSISIHTSHATGTQ